MNTEANKSIRIFFIYATAKNELNYHRIYIKNYLTPFKSIQIEERSIAKKIFVIHLYYGKITFDLDQKIALSLLSNLNYYYETKEYDISITKDNYLYDMLFLKDKWKIYHKYPPDTIHLSHHDQFNIFIDYLQQNNTSKQIKTYLYDASLKLLKNETNLATFDFFLSLFRNTYLDPYGLVVLKHFNVNSTYIPKINTNRYSSIIEAINKPKSFFRNSLKKSSNEKELLLQLDTLVLFYQFHYDRERFIPTIHQLMELQDIIAIISSDKFRGLSLKELEILYMHNHNDSNVIALLLCVTNLDVLMTFCIDNKEKLQKQMENRTINCNMLFIPEVTDNMDKILPKLHQIKKDQKNNYPYLKITIKNIIKDYITFFSENNNGELNKILNHLDSFKSIIKNEKDLSDFKQLIKELALKLIKSKTMTSKDIIKYLSKNIDLLNITEILTISKSISIEEIDDEFIGLFKNAKFHISMNNHYSEFLLDLMAKIVKMKEFSIITKLLQLSQISDSLLQHLYNYFSYLLQNDKPIEENILYENAQILFIITIENKKANYIKTLLLQLQRNLLTEQIISLYIKLLKDFNHRFAFIKEMIVFITGIIEKQSSEETLKIIQLSSNEIVGIIFSEIKQIINGDDLFIFPTNKKVLLLQSIINEKYFSNERKQIISATNYYISSKTFIEKAKKDLENLSIYPSRIFHFANNQNELKQRIELIFYDENNSKKIDILDKLTKVIVLIKELNDELTQVTQYINFYHKNNQNYIDQVSKLNSSFINNHISFTLDNKEEYVFIKEHQQEAVKFNELMKSQFFLTLYNHYKTEDIKQQAFENFNSLIGLFTDCKQYVQENYLIIKILFKEKYTTNNLIKEIEFLQKFFKLPANDNEVIVHNIDILLTKMSYLTKISDLLFMIDQFEVVKTEYYEKLDDYRKTTNSCWDIDKIKELNNHVEIHELQLDNKEKDWMFDIIAITHKRKDLITFLKDKKEDDLRELTNFVDEVDNAYLKETDIQDLFKVVRFINQLKENTSDDFLLINTFFEQCEEEKYKNMNVYFKIVSENLAEIKDLYARVINNEEFSKDMIIQIYIESTFTIELINKKYECNVTYSNKHKKIKTNTFDELLELRDKSLLLSKKTNDQVIQKDELIMQIINNDQSFERNDNSLSSERNSISINNNDKSFSEKCQAFSRTVDKIKTLMVYIIELFNKGYPDDIIVTIKVKEMIANANLYLKEFSLDELITSIKQRLELLTKQEERAYASLPFMNFIYGPFFRTIANYMKYKKTNITHYLKFFTNNQCKNIIDCDYSYDLDLIFNINSFLEDIAIDNYLTLEKIYSNNIIKKPKYEGIHTLYISIEKMEIEVINWYMLLTKNHPIAHTVLLCTKTTTMEEINAFMYRALGCEYYVLFSIINPECLDLEKRKKITTFFNKDHTLKYKAMKSCLMFVYSDRTMDLIEYIRNISNIKILSSLEKADLNIKQNTDNIEVIYSDASGVGKSTQIELEARARHHNYVYFPIGGEITRKRITERLQQHKFKDGKTTLHLDLMDTNKTDQMKDFLFSLLITKCYYDSDNIFYLGNQIDIKIEIPYGFIDYRSKYPILQLFNQRKISIKQLAPLIVSEEITSNIQVVANYLQWNDNIFNNKNIFIPGISNEIMKKLSVTAKPLDQTVCEALIKHFFTVKNPTYYQINAFIDVLGEQFKSFAQSYYTEVELLKNNEAVKNQNIVLIRSFMKNALISITQYFTKGAYNYLINNQNFSLNFGEQFDDYAVNRQAIAQLMKKEVISFDKITPSLVFFNEDKCSFSIISTADKISQEYFDLKNLWNSNKKTTTDELIDYKTIDRLTFIKEIKKVLNLNIPALKVNRKQKDKNSIEEIIDSYVFTADNFIKMILILLRVRAKIPVIMMGETGCGKTSLIRTISQLLNNKMKILNINARTNDDDIITFMKEIQKTLLVLELQQPKQSHNTWVFLDEINTCYSMGLISEMICKHSMEGEPLSKNIIFIAACNPYRATKSDVDIIGLIMKRKPKRNLIYNVNPLPHSLLNFVFDFGNLTEEDEKRYIQSMISSQIDDIFKKANKSLNSKEITKLKELAVNAITFSQQFIRDNYDISSVSLREVRRFVIFYEWFSKTLQDKNNLKEPKKKLGLHRLQENAIILSIYVCYYLRLPKKDLRERFQVKMKDIFGDKFEIIIKDELNDFINRIKPLPGIAKNRALKENLFTLYVCVNNKIPLFICGKPGCSKSLSVQLLYKAMKGDSSEDDFFKTLPRLHMSNYQGSLTSTSKGVLSIFQKARHMIQKGRNPNLISMIYFDEMGLAELSPNNPLKVIHSQLEYDENKDKVAFVGISNWTLDASKMNRGLYLAIPDPDEKDLIDTAIAIASSYDEKLINVYKHLFESLAKTYSQYKDYLINHFPAKAEFHGSRDFYHLIKNVSKTLKNKEDSMNPQQIDLISIEGIERNFGGLEFSMQKIKEIFFRNYSCERSVKDYDVMNCVRENIKEKESRYLIIISKTSISPFLLSNILNNLSKEYSFLIGSQFNEDSYEEHYSMKMLNKIQHCMKEEKILILKNLELIYSSLYDVFNQNFNIVGEKTYARIALGSTNSPMAYINENFKCVILLDEDEIQSQDPPFLNRFEKHILSFEYLLTPEEIKNSEEINDIIKEITEPLDKDTKMYLNLSNQLINCDLEEIQGFIYIKLQEKKEIQNMLEEIITQIAPSFSQDLIGFLDYSIFKNKHPAHFNKIITLYKQKSYKNIFQYLQTMTNTKTIIYTFSSIFDNITISSDKETKINKSIVKELMVSQLRSENETDINIHEFYKKSILKICIFKFSIDDYIHMNHIKYLIENYESNNNIVKKKLFIFLVHVQREYTNNNKEKLINSKDLISRLSTFEQIFIDNVNGSDISITEIIGKTNLELYNDERLILAQQVYQENIYSSFMLLKYDDDSSKIVQHNTEDIIKRYIEQMFIYEGITKTIMKHVQKMTNIMHHIYFNNDIGKNEDIITTMRRILEQSYIKYLNKIIFKLENNSILTEALFQFDYEMLQLCFEDYLNNIDLDIVKLNLNPESNKIQNIKGLSIPGIKIAYEMIFNHIKTIQEIFFANEEDLRKEYLEDDETITEKIKEFTWKENQLINNVYENMNRISMLNLIIRKYKENQLPNNVKMMLERDFFILFMNNNFKTSDADIYEFIQTLIKIRFPMKNQNDFIQLSAEILWLESNISTIRILIDMFIIIKKIAPNITQIIKEIIDNNEIVYEISTRSSEYQEKVNGVFYFALNALLKIPLRNLADFIELKEDSYYDFVNSLKILIQNGNQIAFKMWLISKDLILLSIFIEYNDYLMNTEYRTSANSLAYYKLLYDEAFCISKKDIEGAITKLKEEIIFLEPLLINRNDYGKIIIKKLISKFKQCDNEEYREAILNVALSRNEFIIVSPQLLSLYFYKDMIEPLNVDKDTSEQKLLGDFISFKNEYNRPLQLLNDTTNPVLIEMIVFLFQQKINLFFMNQTDSKYLFGISLKYLDIAFRYIDDVLLNRNKDNLIQLAMWFCISYIKVYLYYFVDVVYHTNDTLGDINPIHKVITSDEGYNPFRKVVKIYILKLFKKYINNFDALKTLPWMKYQISWIREFSFEETVMVLDYSFLSVTKEEDYKTLYNQCTLSGYKTDIKEIINIINNTKDIMPFFDITINQIISQIMKDKFIDSHIYASFSLWATNILNNITITPKSKQVLQICYNSNILVQNLWPKINKISFDIFETLLYSYKFCLISSEAENCWYDKLMSTELIKMIEESYIPGGEIPDNKIVQSAFEIEEFLRFNNNIGVYICSCGSWYQVDKCTLPMEISKCTGCDQKIGGENHRMIIREGHYKIYSDISKKKSHENAISLAELLDKANVIINDSPKGIIKVQDYQYKNNKKPVRGLNQISYRLLSWMFYSVIYYSNVMNFITKEEAHDILIFDTTLLNQLNLAWYALKTALNDEGINYIQIFLHMIFDDLRGIIQNYTDFGTKELRHQFEKNINDLIIQRQQNYPMFYEKYKEINNRMFKVDITSTKSLVNEVENPLIYTETQYPLLKYFILQNYPKIDDIRENLEAVSDSQRKYPVFANFMAKGEEIKKLQQIIHINPLANYMFNHYSYNITREEAKKLIIENEIIKLDNNSLNKLYENYKVAWNKIAPNAVQYECKLLDNPKYMSVNEPIAYFLSDKGELGYGMYLAAAYFYFINTQNDFIQSILDNISMSGITHYFKDSLSQTIIAQNATKNEVVSLDINEDNSNHSSYEDLLYAFATRNCFTNDGKINYSNYQSVSFDFESIEEELGKIILPGKKKFSTEQKFVIYGYEGSRADKSSVIQDYCDKYPQEELTIEEKLLLGNYIANQNHELNKFMFSLQKCIFYIQKNDFSSDKLLVDIINEMPKYVNLLPSCKGFFNQNQAFTVSKLVNVFEYVEHCCFKSIEENIDVDYRKELSDDIKKSIREYFDNPREKRLITKQNLSTAIRKFISRKICGKRDDRDISSEILLLDYLTQSEFWNKEINNNPDFDKEIEEMKKRFPIQTNQSLRTYYYLGGDGELKDLLNHNKNNEDNNNQRKHKRKI